jgi:hypothetical protein
MIEAPNRSWDTSLQHPWYIHVARAFLSPFSELTSKPPTLHLFRAFQSFLGNPKYIPSPIGIAHNKEKISEHQFTLEAHSSKISELEASVRGLVQKCAPVLTHGTSGRSENNLNVQATDILNSANVINKRLARLEAECDKLRRQLAQK